MRPDRRLAIFNINAPSIPPALHNSITRVFFSGPIGVVAGFAGFVFERLAGGAEFVGAVAAPFPPAALSGAVAPLPPASAARCAAAAAWRLRAFSSSLSGGIALFSVINSKSSTVSSPSTTSGQWRRAHLTAPV